MMVVVNMQGICKTVHAIKNIQCFTLYLLPGSFSTGAAACPFRYRVDPGSQKQKYIWDIRQSLI